MLKVNIRNKARRGVTLIEAVLFISIALGLIVGGLVFFQQASLAARTNDAVRNLSSIASETRAAYRTQADFKGLAPVVLINSGAVPSSRISEIAGVLTILNEWNNPVGVAPNAANILGTAALADTLFTITYNNIPASACTRLATATSGSGPIGPGIVGVSVTSSVPATATIGTVALGTVNGSGQATITPADAAVACAVAEPVDVTWVLAK